MRKTRLWRKEYFETYSEFMGHLRIRAFLPKTSISRQPREL